MITITTTNRPSSWGFTARRDGEVIERAESVYRQSAGSYWPPMDRSRDRFDAIVLAAETAGEEVRYEHLTR